MTTETNEVIINKKALEQFIREQLSEDGDDESYDIEDVAEQFADYLIIDIHDWLNENWRTFRAEQLDQEVDQ